MGRGQGDVTLKAGGDTYTIRMSMNAICDIEEESGRSFSEVTDEMSAKTKVSVRLTRLLLWGGLQEHHEGMTIKGAGVVLEAAGLPDTISAVGKAIGAAFGSGDDKPKAKGKDEAPGE